MPIIGVIASSKLKADTYFGYSIGGQTTSGTQLSSVLKWGFSTESQSTLAATLTYVSAASSAGTSYKGNSAYKIGGNGPLTGQTYVSKWSYATGAKTDVSTSISGRGYAAGISNPSTAGYAWCGEGGSPLSYYANAQKITYSNDSLSTVSTGGVPGNTNQPGGTNNGSTYGYRLGGDSQNVGRITFSNDTLAVLSVSIPPEYNTVLTYGTTAGYIMGGVVSGVNSNAIRKFTFSNESASTLSATLSSSRILSISFSDRATYGWCLGGNDGVAVNVIQKFTFSSETISTLGSTLSEPRYNGANADNYQQEAK